MEKYLEQILSNIVGPELVGPLILATVVLAFMFTQWHSVKTFAAEFLPRQRARQKLLSNIAHVEKLLAIEEKQKALKVDFIDTRAYGDALIDHPELLEELGATPEAYGLSQRHGVASAPYVEPPHQWSLLRRLLVGIPLYFVTLFLGVLGMGTAIGALDGISDGLSDGAGSWLIFAILTAALTASPITIYRESRGMIRQKGLLRFSPLRIVYGIALIFVIAVAFGGIATALASLGG